MRITATGLLLLFLLTGQTALLASSPAAWIDSVSISLGKDNDSNDTDVYYVGFQNNEARAKFDLAVIGGDPAADGASVVARVTPGGGWLTRRFAVGNGALYWVASGYSKQRRQRPGQLFRSTDGRTFSPVPLPDQAGPVHDLVVVDDTAFVLTAAGLYAGTGPGSFRRVASKLSSESSR